MPRVSDELRGVPLDLILNDTQPLHWAVGGALIAAVTATLLFVGNRQLSVSSSFDDICSIVVDTDYFQRYRRGLSVDGTWRLSLLGGLVLGGLFSALLGGGWEPTWDLGRFDKAIGWSASGKIVWMFGGGLLIGFGTRLGGGCTSGHGIFGLSNFQLPSLITMVSFMVGGIVFTNLLYRVIL